MSTSSRCIPRHPANKSARTKSPQIRNFRIINVRSSLKLESRRVHVISKLPSCPTHFHPFSIRGTMILMIVTDNRIRITRITRIIRFIIWSNNREESSENREKNSVLLSRELNFPWIWKIWKWELRFWLCFEIYILHTRKLYSIKKIFPTLSFLPIFLKHVESFVKCIQIRIEMGNLVNLEDFSKYFLKFQSYLTRLSIRSNFPFSEFSLDILNYKFYSSFQKFIISIKD